MGRIPRAKEAELRSLLDSLEDPRDAEEFLERKGREARAAAEKARKAREARKLAFRSRDETAPEDPPPLDAEAAREAAEAERARDPLDRLRSRWTALEVLVEALEEEIDAESPPPTPAAVAEVGAIEKAARRLAELERAATLTVRPADIVVPPERKKMHPVLLLLGTVATGIFLPGAAHVAFHATVSAMHGEDEKRDSKVLAAQRRRILGRAASSRERKARKALVEDLERALPAEGPGVEEVRFEIRRYAAAPLRPDAVGGPIFALSVRLGVLRRDHLVARARALLAAAPDAT